jgi:ABC-type branched-subunit amino acid transport system substrate-binding protein
MSQTINRRQCALRRVVLRRVGACLATTLLVAGTPELVWGQVDTIPFAGTAPPQVDTIRYANTPAELLPFSRFQSPYVLFFADRLEYLGPGRDKTASGDLTEVRLGFLGPIEGSRDAPLGSRMLQGATLAVEEANEEGGYEGLPFVLMVRNDLGLWGASSNELVALHDAGVWGTLGSIDGANTHIMLRIALKIDMPMIVSGDTDPTFSETRIPWAVRVTGDDRQSNYALALHIHDVLGYRRVAVLRVNNRYGRVGTGEFKDALRRLGSPIVLEMRYTQGDTTFDAQLERIRRVDPEAVLIWGDALEAGLIAREMRAQGMEQPIFGSDRLVSDAFLEIAGEAAEGVVATYPYNPTLDDPLLRDFNRRYRERFGEEAETFAAHAYDGMKILIDAIRTAGLNRVRIRDELTSLRRYRGVTGEIVFDERWDDVGTIWMAEIRNGSFHFFPTPLKEGRHGIAER